MNQHDSNMADARGFDDALLGIGLYSIPETARLLGAPVQRVRRWLTGYGPLAETGGRLYAGLWKSDVVLDDGSQFLSFRDLMEMRVAARFAIAGVRLNILRKCHARAAHVLGTDRPFSDERFSTDGRTIFLEEPEAEDDSALLDLLNGQWVFRRFLAPTFKDVEHRNGSPVRWWALDRKRSVVLDPSRSFGQPIVAASGVPTSVLAEAASVEGSVRKAAMLYEVEEREVKDAVAFEERIAA